MFSEKIDLKSGAQLYWPCCGGKLSAGAEATTMFSFTLYFHELGSIPVSCVNQELGKILLIREVAELP